MSNQEYNGWTNYETWLVNVEVLDGIDFTEFFDLKPTEEEFRDYLKDFVDENLSCFDELVITDSIAYSFAMRFVAKANFYELANHFYEQFENYCDECAKQFEPEEIRPWKYEPIYRYCDDCYTERLADDERNER